MGFIGLCCALILLIRQKYRQALFFLAIAAWVLPLHSMLLPLFGKGRYFIFPYPGSRPSESAWEMLWQSKQLVYYLWLLYLLLTAGGALVVQQHKVSGIIYYRVLLGIIMVTIVCQFIPVQNADATALPVQNELKALFYGGTTAWFITLMNYLCKGTRNVLQQVVFCIAIIAAAAGCFLIYKEVVPVFTLRATVFLVRAFVSALLALSFYYIYPHKFVPAVFALLSFVFEGIVLCTSILRDYVPGFLLQPDASDIWQSALIFLPPMLAAPFFREKANPTSI